MQPDQHDNGLPLRALATYCVVTAVAVMVAAGALGRWLASLGLPWPLALGAQAAAVLLMVKAMGPLSTAAIPAMVRRFPALGRGRILPIRGEDEHHAA